MLNNAQTISVADWALIISICSLLISVAGFVWNVWSKFIFPKAKVRVTFGPYKMYPPKPGIDSFFSLSATNYGPGPVTVNTAVLRSRKNWWRRLENGILSPLHDFPIKTHHTIGPLSGGLPKKLEVGESFSSYFPFPSPFMDEPIIDIGFVDSFSRYHWASRKAVRICKRKQTAERNK